MKHIVSYNQIAILLTLLLLGTACNVSVKNDSPLEKENPKLIKTTGGNGNLECGLQDKAGNLWFGTSDNGLYKYDGKSFKQFLVQDGLSSNSIYSLLEDTDGSIWIGTENGPCRYDGNTFVPIQIPLPIYLPPNKNEVYHNSHRVYDMLQAKSGNIWFVTIDGLYIYDGKAFTLFTINEAANGFLTSNDKVERILEDKAGNIWMGSRTNNGVYRYDGISITHFELEEFTLQFGTKQVTHSWAWPQMQDKNGNIWFSNWGGAYRYDGKSFTSFSKSDGLPGENGLVTKIIEGKNGTILFGGAGGLASYDGKSFTGYSNGLINPWIWEILKDNIGNIWVGTRETGLYQFDGNNFINFSAYTR